MCRVKAESKLFWANSGGVGGVVSNDASVKLILDLTISKLLDKDSKAENRHVRYERVFG